MKNIKNDFPIFQNQDIDFVYLDSGATTQKPQCLIEALTEYYSKYNANIGRGSYDLASQSDKIFLESRKRIATFFNAKENRTIFSSGATESSNLIIDFISRNNLLNGKKKVITSIMEHNSNLLPLQRLCKENNLELVYIEQLDILSNPENLPDNFFNDVGLISLTHVSNTTGFITPIHKWASFGKKHNIITIFDGSQGVTSEKVDIDQIGCDFYYFSAHKLYGPMGLGVFFISDRFFQYNPPKIGGGTVDYVTKESYDLSSEISKFDAGTPNVADIYAFSKCLDYIEENWEEIEKLQVLSEYMFFKLRAICTKNYQVYVIDDESRYLDPSKYSHILSFVIKNRDPMERGIHSHDIGSYLSDKNICVRYGMHCAHPLHYFHQVAGTTRFSLGLYNTQDDIDKALQVLTDGLNRFEAL